MRLLLALPLLLTAIPAQAAERRCGILANPTPANWWLTDRDGEWLIGAQGGYQAEGIDNIPESMFGRGWIATNGSYGYRCACLRVDTVRASKRIRRIHSATPLARMRCSADPAMRKQWRAAGH